MLRSEKLAAVTVLLVTVAVMRLAALTPAYAAAGAAPDLIALAESTWGTPINQFPTLAGLKVGEYSQGNQPPPLPQDVQVIMPFFQMTEGRWEPRELFPLEFEFTQSTGLREIAGFLQAQDQQPTVVALVTSRYGPPTKSASALNMTTYAWEIGNTVLEISPFLFRIYPKNRTAN